MSLFRSKSAPETEPRFHVVVSDVDPDGEWYELDPAKGAMSSVDAFGLFNERLAERAYPADGPVRLRVIGEKEFAALSKPAAPSTSDSAAAVAVALLES